MKTYNTTNGLTKQFKISVIVFLLILSISTNAQQPLCSDPSITSAYFSIGTETKSGETTYQAPLPYQVSAIQARLFYHQLFIKNLWDDSRRQEHYEHALIDIVCLSAYTPERIRIIQKEFLNKWPDALKQSQLYECIISYLNGNINLTQNLSEIKAKYVPPIRDLSKVLSAIDKILSTPVPPTNLSALGIDVVNLFGHAQPTTYNSLAKWLQIQNYLKPFQPIVKTFGIALSDQKFKTDALDILINASFTQVLADSSALERFSILEESLQNHWNLSKDQAFVNALLNVKIFLNQTKAEQYWTVVCNSFRDDQSAIIGDVISLASSIGSESVANTLVNLAVSKGASFISATSVTAWWTTGIWVLTQEYLIILGIDKQLDDAESSVSYSTIAYALFSKTTSYCELKPLATYAYYRSAKLVAKSASYYPIPFVNPHKDVAEQWEALSQNFLAKTNADFNTSCTQISTILSDGEVNPSNGSSKDTFKFSIIYKSIQNFAPDSVILYVDGIPLKMTHQGNTWSDGVNFEYSGHFSAGTHSFHMEASVSGSMLPPTSEGSFTVIQPGSNSFVLTLNSNKLKIGDVLTANLVLTPSTESYPINFSSSNSTVLKPLFSNPILTDAKGVAVAQFKANSLGTADITATDESNPSLTKTKNADVVSYISVAVGTNPEGRTFKVDGNTYSTSQTFQWQAGSFHSIYAIDSQDGSTGTKYEWANWNNGGGISQVVSPTSDINYTATYTTKYYFTAIAGNGGEINPASGWYVSGTSVNITANNYTFYKFNSWNGDLTGDVNPASLLMNGPKSVSTNFVSDSKLLQILSTNPNSGLAINVSPADKNGISQGTTPLNLVYDAGTIVTITAPLTAAGIPFEAWKYTDGASYSNSATLQKAMSQDWTYSATYSLTPPSEWSTITTGTVGDLYSVVSLNANTFYAVGYDYNPANGYYDHSLVIKSTDGGLNWDKLTLTNIGGFKKICFPSSSIGYILAGNGKVLKTVDGGNNWSQLGDIGGGGISQDNIAFASTQIGFAFSGTRIYQTTDGGSNWTFKDLKNPRGSLNSMYFTSTAVGIAVGSSGEIVKTTDGGTTWIEKTCPTSAHLNSVYFPSSLIGYAVGNGGVIMKTIDGGETWILQNSPTLYTLNDVSFSDIDNGYAVGDYDIIKTTNGSQTWVKQIVNTGNSMNGVAAISSISCIAVGESGSILVYKGSKIVISGPIGGDNFIAEQTTNITWNSTNVSKITLEYSTNNGSNWNTIQTGVNASLGTFTWNVPNTPSSQCKIRIINESNPGTYDVSANTFTIIGKPSLTITSPIGGEDWVAGQSETITWKSNCIDKVNIELSTDKGVNWMPVVENISADLQAYHYIVPNIVSRQSLMRISYASDTKVNTVSKDVFSITIPHPEIPRLLSPSDLALDQDTNLVLTWSKSINVSKYLLQVSDKSDFTNLIKNDTITADTTEVLNNLKYLTKYYWRVQSINKYTKSDFSPVSYFTTKQLKLQQVITFDTIPEKTYGNTDFYPHSTTNSNLEVTYQSDNTSIAIIVGGKIHIVAAGRCNIIALHTGNDIYKAAPNVSRTLIINKANLDVFSYSYSKTYGEENHELKMGFCGFVDNDDASILDVLPKAKAIVDKTTKVGTYEITMSGGSDNNYKYNLLNGFIKVVNAPLTAIADNKSKIYGSANPALTVSYTGFMNGENNSVIDTLPLIATTATNTSNTGTYPITLSGSNDNNYTITKIDGTLTIYKAMLIATAKDTSRKVGEPNPSFKINYSGFVNNDNETVIDIKPLASCSANIESNAGSYVITLAGAVDNNYEFAYKTGILNILSTGTNSLNTCDIKIYPNPFKESIFIEFINVSFENTEVTVIDLCGKVITKKEYFRINGNNKETIDLFNISAGIYFIRIKDNERTKMYRLVKQ